MERRRFRVGLALIVLAALAGRIIYVFGVTLHATGKVYDSFWYSFTADQLSHGHFFESLFLTGPTASHPPLTSLLIGSPALLTGGRYAVTLQYLTMAVIGAGVVWVVGLLARDIFGARVGLVAAVLAAVAPNFWIPSGILMSEAPTMLCMALLLMAVVRFLRSPSGWRAALIGAACGAEALARAELILVVPCLLVPAVLVAHRVSWPRRLTMLAVGILAVVVVVGPWVGRNLVTFRDPTYLSTGNGLVLLGANCPVTYSSAALGMWDYACATSVTSNEESVQSTLAQRAGLRYAEKHSDSLPAVVLARIGRLWDVYRPVQSADVEVGEGRPLGASLAGLGLYYALVPLAAAGIVIGRRRGIALWYLLVPAGVETLVAALTYGQVRFRAPFEVCLVVLAAPPLVLAGQRLARRSGTSVPSVSPTGSGEELSDRVG